MPRRAIRHGRLAGVAIAIIVIALGLRFWQLTHQWEHCAPNHDAILRMLGEDPR